jgi:hypothetical protein
MHRLLYVASCVAAAVFGLGCTSKEPQSAPDGSKGPEQVVHADAAASEARGSDSQWMDASASSPEADSPVDPDSMASPDAVQQPDAGADSAAEDAPPPDTGGPCASDGACPAPFTCFYPVQDTVAGCGFSATHGFCGTPASGVVCSGKRMLTCGCDGGVLLGCGPQYIPPNEMDAGVCYMGSCVFDSKPAFGSTARGACVYDASPE